jgi:hypothetical protein
MDWLELIPTLWGSYLVKISGTELLGLKNYYLEVGVINADVFFLLILAVEYINEGLILELTLYLFLIV